MSNRVYIEIIAKHAVDGKSTPLTMIWEDGRRFEIDRILDIRRAASLKAGGAGIRYTCSIRGKDIYIYDDEGRWFMEGK